MARGPFVYAIEQADNGPRLNDLRLPRNAECVEAVLDSLPDVVAVQATGSRDTYAGHGLYRTEAPTEQPADLLLIPHYAWANRGAGEMRVCIGEGGN